MISREVREQLLPGPAPDSGYRTVLLVGTTGSGKTTLVRQLIGTDPEREPFPATSTFKTTTAELEIVCAPGDYYAAATFSPRERVRADVSDCVVAAGVALGTGRPEQVALDSLRVHLDHRLRLEYVLGDDGGWDGAAMMSLRTILADLPPSIVDAGREAELEDTLRHHTGVASIVSGLMGQIAQRFGGLVQGQLVRDEHGWPRWWTFSAGNRSDFLRTLRKLTGNERASYGTQLSPLVDGVRARGPFHPAWAPEIPYLVLADSVGLGHTPESASSLPAALIDQLDRADHVVVVDDATHPMQAAPIEAIRQIVASGHGSKLVLAFTHLDEVQGVDVATSEQRRARLRRSVDQLVATLGSDLDAAGRRILRDHLDHSVAFLDAIHAPIAVDDDETVAELRGLLDRVRGDAEPIEADSARPVYRSSDLRTRMFAATSQFGEDWRIRTGVDVASAADDPELGPGVVSLHWSRLQALCARMAGGVSETYGDLRPVDDLHRLLLEGARRWALSPIRWDGVLPTDEQRLARLDAFSRAVSPRLQELARTWLVERAHPVWQEASRLTGTRSADQRALLVADEIVGALLSGTGGPGSFVYDTVAVVREIAHEHGCAVADTVLPPVSPPRSPRRPSPPIPEPDWAQPVGPERRAG
ncbi:MAG: hypothetical protein S0880_18010 [Actinomycetota bacterium]|nr:hypothetical protein [Actinomycetota bacterium]